MAGGCRELCVDLILKKHQTCAHSVSRVAHPWNSYQRNRIQIRETASHWVGAWNLVEVFDRKRIQGLYRFRLQKSRNFGCIGVVCEDHHGNSGGHSCIELVDRDSNVGQKGLVRYDFLSVVEQADDLCKSVYNSKLKGQHHIPMI